MQASYQHRVTTFQCVNASVSVAVAVDVDVGVDVNDVDRYKTRYT